MKHSAVRSELPAKSDSKPKITTFWVESVLFGLNSTLVDAGAVVERSWLRWVLQMGLEPGTVLAAAHGRVAHDLMAELLPDNPSEQHRQDAVRIADQQAGDASLINAVSGAADLISSLDGRWGIVTSAPRRVAEAWLSAAGLSVPAVLVTAEDVSAGKPKSNGYLAAARRLDVRPYGCLVIESSLPGIAAAHAAGMLVVGVGTRVEDRADDLVGQIESLRQVRAVADLYGIRGVIHEKSRS